MKKLLIVLGGLVAFLVAGAVVLGVIVYKSQKERCDEVLQRQRAFPAQLVSVTDLRLNDVRTEITGRVTNRSDRPMYSFSLDVEAQDCTPSGCPIVGRQTFPVELLVPAGEARDFQARQMLGNALASIQQRGTLKFDVSISNVSGISNSEWIECHNFRR